MPVYAPVQQLAAAGGLVPAHRNRFGFRAAIGRGDRGAGNDWGKICSAKSRKGWCGSSAESVLHRSHWQRQKAAQVAPASIAVFQLFKIRKNRLLN